jgi:hypothetical protein|tara:strand:+ start:1131 stop:1400 length:270 start_codon:yes stop_codon:yes gene_type:complete
MATNITSKFLAGTGVIVTTQGMTRVMAIHAYSTVVGTCALSDSTGDKIKFQIAQTGMADIYIGELGVRFDGTVCCSITGANGGVTLFVG